MNRSRDRLLDGATLRLADWERRWFAALAAIVVGYAWLGSLHPVYGDDLFFLLNDARWLVEHHEIPSIDHFSYTAQGQPWIYPVGGGLLFYGLWLIGGYASLSWFAALATAATTALLLRRGSVIFVVLAALAVPLIAARTGVRADMFTTVLSAAYLGFFVGLGLVGGYVLVESLEFFWPERRQAAAGRLRQAGPWFIMTAAATALNPFGFEIYSAVFRQLTAPQLELMWEWQPIPINWSTLSLIGAPISGDGARVLVMIIAVATALVATWRKQFGAAVLLLGTAIAAVQHVRSEALLAIVTVIVGGSVLDGIKMPIGRWARPTTAAILAVVLTGLLIDMGSRKVPLLGTWLSREYPEGAISFIERERIPPQILATRFGSYFIWRLWPKYLDYSDARTIPFGPAVLEQLGWLAALPPEAPAWQWVTERYDINAVLAVRGPLGFRLAEFCASSRWIPVYLDEVSAVFVRRRPENEEFNRLRIDCNTIGTRSSTRG